MGLRIYANGKDLKDVPVVQNEKGWYYLYNGTSTYWKPKLADFDSGKGKPSNVKKYDNDPKASHKSNPSLNRIDFSLIGGTKITFNQAVKVNGLPKLSKFKNPYGVEIVVGDIHLFLNHTHLAPGIQVGKHYPAGTVVVIVNNQSENKASAGDFPPHLEALVSRANPKWEQTTIRQLILAKETMPEETSTPVPVPVPEPVPTQPPVINPIPQDQGTEKPMTIEELLMKKDQEIKALNDDVSTLKERNRVLSEQLTQVVQKNGQLLDMAKKLQEALKQYGLKKIIADLFSRLTSRKFLFASFATGIFVAQGLGYIHMDQQTLTNLLIAIGGYVGVEGVADIVERSKKQ